MKRLRKGPCAAMLSPPLRVLGVGPGEQRAAVAILKRFSDQPLPLTDAVGLHVMATNRRSATIASPNATTRDAGAELLRRARKGRRAALTM